MDPSGTKSGSLPVHISQAVPCTRSSSSHPTRAASCSCAKLWQPPAWGSCPHPAGLCPPAVELTSATAVSPGRRQGSSLVPLCTLCSMPALLQLRCWHSFLAAQAARRWPCAPTAAQHPYTAFTHSKTSSSKGLGARFGSHSTQPQ